MTDSNPPRDKRIRNGQEFTQVTSLKLGEATTEEMIDDLLHQLDVYINDVIVKKTEPFWLYRQTWKRDGEPIPTSEYTFEFLEWAITNTLAKIELARPGEEPVNGLPLAQMAQVLLDTLTGETEALQEQLDTMPEANITAGFIILGVVIAMHKDELGGDQEKTLGARS